MKHKNILIVFGTRPEAIKMAPLIKEFESFPSLFKLSVCVTAQHREMLDQILDLYEIKPDFDLNVMTQGQDLNDLTSLILKKIKHVYLEVNPDIVIVHGDTTTTMAASLAAFYLNIPVAHIEAGLRTYDRMAPYPEEINRQIVTRLSTWHFAPTFKNQENLLNENVQIENISVTGNTVIDSLCLMNEKISSDMLYEKKIHTTISKELNFDIKKNKYILITGHRRENFGNGFDEICSALLHLAKKYSDLKFIFPVHLNPNVVKPVKNKLDNIKNIHLLKPLEYQNFTFLLKYCFCILTDSGGIQEEAPAFDKPVIVMRELTERQEGVDAGTIKLVGSNKKI